MKKYLLPFILLAFFNISFAQSTDITTQKVRKMVDYIHENYRNDYTSFGNTKILDWQKAIVSMMYVHAYEVLGDRKYLDWANDALYVEYNLSDDQCWGANALLELNQHEIKTATREYKNEEGKSFTMKYSYQDIFNFGLTTAPKVAPDPYFGYYDTPETGGLRGVYWNRQCSSYNTCTLGQSIVLAFRMPEKEVNGKSPLEFASTWMNLQNNLLIDQSTGLIFDNYQLKSKQSNKGNYSYNNGIVLGAIGLAKQKASTNHPYIDQTSMKVVDFVVTSMTENGVLCSPSADYRNNNAHAFNGIFMHFVPFFLFSDCPDAAKNQMKSFISACASAVWKQVEEKQNQDNRYAISFYWGKPFNGSETNCMTTVSGVECLLTYLQMSLNQVPFDYKK